MTELQIAPTGLKISLLSVVPGQENQVAAKLTKAIASGSDSDPIAILKLFGRYDVCAIYKTENFLSGPSKKGSIDGIRGGNQIFAFPYCSKLKSNWLEYDPNYGIWGLLFFRTNQHLAKDFGVMVEAVLADISNNFQKKDIKVDILGTTGWAELVFLVRGNKFQSVTDTLSQISQQVVSVQYKDSSNEHLFSIKTFSLLGIDFRCLKNPSNLPNLFNEKFNLNSIHPIVSITCSPGDMRKVFTYAGEVLGKGFSTYGGRDYLFDTTKCETWGQLLETVVKMRKDLCDSIYATGITVLCPTKSDEFKDYPLKIVNRQGINVNKSLLKLFSKWGPIFENRLLNLFFGISNLMQDPLIGHCFEDLRPMVNSRLPQLLKSTSPDDFDARAIVWEIVEALSCGAMERANGAFLAIEYVENRFSPTRGGIQRILKAAQVIPQFVLTRIGINWNGFFVAGFQNMGFSSHGEIINLPYDFLFKPEEWWGFFHEIGHVALWETDFLDLLNENEVISQLNDLSANHKNKAGRDFWQNLFLEIGADSFDLFFCHDSNINAYFLNIWPYISRLTKKIEVRHFARYFCVFQYWQYLVKIGENSFPLRMDLDFDLELFKKHLRKLNLNIPSEAECDIEAKRFFYGTSKVIEVCHRAYVARKKTYLRSAEEELDNTENVIKQVLKGKVVTDSIIERPDKFILSLREKSLKKTLGLDARIAAILSLWHTATVTMDH